jgi:hypothetical protein
MTSGDGHDAFSCVGGRAELDDRKGFVGRRARGTEAHTSEEHKPSNTVTTILFYRK